MRALIVIHDNHQPSNVFPLGPAYIASVLRKEGVDVETYCMDVYHSSNDDLAAYLDANSFDMILLGFMVPRFRRTVRELCRVMNEHKNDAWFILGGYGPSAIPEYVINETGADIVCVGEAESTIVDIKKAKESANADLSKIRGIAFKHNNEVIITERQDRIKDLDSIPFPAWDLFPMDIYTTNLVFAGMAKNEKAFPLISGRGCTDRCTFCFRLEKGIRSRSVDSIIEEMLHLHNVYGVTYFYFCDELALVSREKILSLTSAIKKSFKGIYYRMDCRVSLFDDEIATALKESGCEFLNIGFESSSQLVLDQMNKRATVQQNIDAAETAIRHNIGIGINVIWGMPGDNEKTLRENSEFIKKYNQYDQLRTIRPVTPYPGSPLYYNAISEGMLKGEQDFFDKFKNADLYMVNFMKIPEDDIYRMLYEVNKDLIYDHYNHTNKDFVAAEAAIKALYDVYFNKKYDYVGPKSADRNEGLRNRSFGK